MPPAAADALLVGLPDEAARALAREIVRAFARVRREEGVSWSEARVMDLYGSPAERTEARAKDLDEDWTELANNPGWDPSPGVGGLIFLDAISFRYYLPAVMIRYLRDPYEESGAGLDFHLDPGRGSRRDWKLDKWSRLNTTQRACVARLVRHEMERDEAHELYAGGLWRQAYESYWRDFDPDAQG